VSAATASAQTGARTSGLARASAPVGSGSSFCSSYGGLSTSGVFIDSDGQGIPGVYPCGNPNIHDQFGYQCEEFSNRFENVVYGEAPVNAYGRDVVKALHSQDGVPIQEMGAGHIPQPGDVISMWSGSAYPGHTGVVYSVTVNTANGNGKIVYYDENGSQSGGKSIGYDTINVNNWQMSDWGYNTFDWTLQNTHASVALIPNNGASGYSVDGFGNLHAFGNAPQVTSPSPLWQGWDIVRGIVVAHNSTKWAATGYVLDGYGGIHPFAAGSATLPATPNRTAYWSRWDIARGIVLAGNNWGYVLDGWGGIHPFAAPGVTMPATPVVTGYWPNWPANDGTIARGIVLTTAVSGYVLDGYGGIHPFAAPGFPMPATPVITGYSGWDIARSITVTGSGAGYVLDGWGGVHPFAPPGVTRPTAPASPHWSHWDIARAITVDPASGIIAEITGTGYLWHT
jgi:hypothetical protein